MKNLARDENPNEKSEPSTPNSVKPSSGKRGRAPDEKFDVIGSTGFMAVHATCLLVFVVGVSWPAVITCVALYAIRMFGITGGYHRYFAHRSYKTSRLFQFFLGFLGNTSAQLGPLWWAAHHRHHHRYSDQDEDLHSPLKRGFIWAHVGWVVCKKYSKTNFQLIPDFAKFPELRFLNRFNLLAPFLLAVGVFFFGMLLEKVAPSWGTNAWQMLIWGFFVSTTFLYHGTFTINSLAHVWGKRRFKTEDDSRNNFWLAMITLGEGWHNNHHRYPYSVNQGFYWYEVDIAMYVIKFLSFFGIVWDVKSPPRQVLAEGRTRSR